MVKPSPSALSEAVGISQSYASMILSEARVPPVATAVRIFRKTNWRHPIIEGLTEDQLEGIEAADKRKAQAA